MTAGDAMTTRATFGAPKFSPACPRRQPGTVSGSSLNHGTAGTTTDCQQPAPTVDMTLGAITRVPCRQYIDTGPPRQLLNAWGKHLGPSRARKDSGQEPQHAGVEGHEPLLCPPLQAPASPPKQRTYGCSRESGNHCRSGGNRHLPNRHMLLEHTSEVEQRYSPRCRSLDRHDFRSHRGG